MHASRNTASTRPKATSTKAAELAKLRRKLIELIARNEAARKQKPR